MNNFTIRPGYQSKDLLIEFNTSLEVEDFQEKMLGVFNDLGLKPIDVMDTMFFQAVEFEIEEGTFAFDLDEWGFFWIRAKKNETIEALAKMLEGHTFLKRIEVDWNEYK